MMAPKLPLRATVEAGGFSRESLCGRLRTQGDNELELLLRGPIDSPLMSAVAKSRIQEMLRALWVYVGGLAPAQRDRLDEPVPIGDGAFVTSRLLLAAAATFHCQERWPEERFFHDIEDASAVERALTDASRGFAEMASSLVVWKNAFRTAWGPNKESLVWRDGRILDDDEAVADAFGPILLSMGVTGAMLDALSLVAYAYQSRQAIKHAFAPFGRFRDRIAKAQADELAGPKQTGGTLLIGEFSRHAFGDPTARARAAAQVARKWAEPAGKYKLIWWSLDRFWSTKFPQKFGDIRVEECLRPYTFETPRSLAQMVKACAAAVLRLSFEGDEAFQFLFGRPAPTGGPWPRLQAVFDDHPGKMSLGFVLAVLRNMANIYPAEFTAVKVHTEGMHDPLNPWIRVSLPRDVPEVVDLEARISDNRYGRDARFVVARALAAVLLNRRVILGAFTETVAAETPADSRLIADWKRLVDTVAGWDHHAALDSFLRLYLAPHGNTTSPAARRLLSDAADPLVLAADIGGTGVKVSLYLVRPTTGRLGDRMEVELTVPTVPDGWNQVVADKQKYAPQDYIDALERLQYEDAGVFVRKIRDELARKLEAEWSNVSRRIVAVGVAYPGAVAGKDLAEYVAANSGTLSYFKGIHPTRPWLADVERVHGLHLREAFETVFAVDGVAPPVRLLNDGTAHVLGHAMEFSGAGFGWADWVLGLVVGTGFGSAGYQRASARPIPGLFEVGRVITYVSVPFTKDFPAGTARDYLSSSALARIPRDLLGADGELPDTPSLLLGWVLEGGTDDAFERRWEQERPAEEKRTLEVLRAALADYLRLHHSAKWADAVTFAGEVADTAGRRLADVVATMVEMTGALNVFAAGGALSGAFGKRVRAAARRELRERYGFDVEMAVGADPSVRHKLARLLRFPEPDSSRQSGDIAGTLGLARDVCEVLWPQPAEPTQAVPSIRAPVATRWGSCGLSAYSMAALGRSCPARLLFPGRGDLDAGTFGYVRSNQRSQRAAELGRVPRETPWRDYSDSALTPVRCLVAPPFSGHQLVVSARNTCNEYLYQVRLSGKWFRRCDDPPIPQEWPVVTVGTDGTAIRTLSSAGESGTDIVAGLPLVTEGRPASRAFLISNSSDAAHMYEVDPYGRRGSPRGAWVELSDLWQKCKDSGLPDDQLASETDRLAASLSIHPAESLLHSVIAQGWDGTLVVYAITGGLAVIATELAEVWGVRHAILLDNGGSVGWHALVEGSDSPSLLVAGPNYRPRGTAFLVFTLPGFLHPLAHGALRPFGGGS